MPVEIAVPTYGQHEFDGLRANISTIPVGAISFISILKAGDRTVILSFAAPRIEVSLLA